MFTKSPLFLDTFRNFLELNGTEGWSFDSFHKFFHHFSTVLYLANSRGHWHFCYWPVVEKMC